VQQLAGVGLIRPGEHRTTFRLPPALEAAAEALAAVDFSSPFVAERWAEHLGDYLFLGGDRAPGQRRIHRRYLLDGLDRLPRAFLSALEPVLPAAEFVEACARAIDGEAGVKELEDGRRVWAAGYAIERLEAHPSFPVCSAVARFLQRADPARDYPWPP